MLDNYIAKVRKRCLEQNLDPNVIPTFTRISQEELLEIKEEYKDTLKIIKSFMIKFLGKIKGIPLMVAVTDNKGNFIEYLGDESLKDTVVNQIGMREGVQFATEEVGTSSIVAAIDLKQSVQLIGTDHYHYFLHQTACYTAPLFIRGNLIGTISIMTFLDHASPMIRASLETLVDSIERELALLEQNRYLDEMNEMILNQSSTGYIVLDESGRIEKVNPRACSILKARITHIKEIDTLYQLHQQFAEGKVIRGKKLVLQGTNENITCLVDYFDFNDGGLIQLHDISEYNKTESYIQNAEKLSILGQLAAGVAHEIKNPLTTLKGFIQLIQENRFSESYTTVMLNEIKRIDQITNEFLVLSRPTVQAKQLYDIQQLFGELEVLLSSFAIPKNIQIDRSIAEIPAIYCDANQLKQVFINIVKNSVEVLSYNGKILISVQPYTSSEILIRFEDDGSGFPQHILHKVGQPFITTKENGNGLGIMICKRIVEAIHSGSLKVYNSTNGGAVVDIILPHSQNE
jgi:signal transduction histidine kinase